MRATEIRAQPGCAPESITYYQCAAELEAAYKADARALWAVRVLDAWRNHTTLWWSVDNQGDETSGDYWVCFTMAGGYRALGAGSTPYAARLAAAEAVYPTLPADTRAQLGERP